MELLKTLSFPQVEAMVAEGRKKVIDIHERMTSLRVHAARRTVFHELQSYLGSDLENSRTFLDKFPSVVADMPAILQRAMATRTRIALTSGVLREVFGGADSGAEFRAWIESHRKGMIRDAIWVLSRDDDFFASLSVLDYRGLTDTKVLELPPQFDFELKSHCTERFRKPVTVGSLDDIRELLIPILSIQRKYFDEQSGRAANDGRDFQQANIRLSEELTLAKATERQEITRVLGLLRTRLVTFDETKISITSLDGSYFEYSPSHGFSTFSLPPWDGEVLRMAQLLSLRLLEIGPTPKPPHVPPKKGGGGGPREMRYRAAGTR